MELDNDGREEGIWVSPTRNVRRRLFYESFSSTLKFLRTPKQQNAEAHQNQNPKHEKRGNLLPEVSSPRARRERVRRVAAMRGELGLGAPKSAFWTGCVFYFQQPAPPSCSVFVTPHGLICTPYRPASRVDCDNTNEQEQYDTIQPQHDNGNAKEYTQTQPIEDHDPSNAQHQHHLPHTPSQASRQSSHSAQPSSSAVGLELEGNAVQRMKSWVTLYGGRVTERKSAPEITHVVLCEGKREEEASEWKTSQRVVDAEWLKKCVGERKLCALASNRREHKANTAQTHKTAKEDVVIAGVRVGGWECGGGVLLPRHCLSPVQRLSFSAHQPRKRAFASLEGMTLASQVSAKKRRRSQDGGDGSPVSFLQRLREGDIRMR